MSRYEVQSNHQDKSRNLIDTQTGVCYDIADMCDAPACARLRWRCAELNAQWEAQAELLDAGLVVTETEHAADAALVATLCKPRRLPIHYAGRTNARVARPPLDDQYCICPACASRRACGVATPFSQDDHWNDCPARRGGCCDCGDVFLGIGWAADMAQLLEA